MIVGWLVVCMLHLAGCHCRLVREEGYTGLIIGLTGDTSLEDVKYFKAHGADAVLPKPFVVAEFNRVVQEFLGRQSQ